MNRVPHAALLLTVLGVSVAQSGWGQPSNDPLPRRGWFGIALGTNDAGNVIVTSVQPGTTAAEMGIEAGDAVRTVDGVAMQTPADVIAAIGGTHRAGDRVTLDIVRAGVERSLAATLKPFPAERVPGSDVEYGSVALESGVRLRTIVTVPTGISSRAPAVFVLQGGGCSSVDQPLAMPIGTVQTIHTIAAVGFVTLRMLTRRMWRAFPSASFAIYRPPAKLFDGMPDGINSERRVEWQAEQRVCGVGR